MFVNKKNRVLALFLCSFFCMQSMELTYSDNTVPISDPVLQKLIKSASCVSLGVATIVKEHAQRNNVAIIPQNMGSLLQLDQDNINEMFLTHVKDDELRPLLLSMGAQIDARRKEHGSNCLWDIDDPQLLVELIKEGADANAIDIFGETALTFLCHYRRPYPKSKKFFKVINSIKVLLSFTNISDRRYKNLLHRMLLNPSPWEEEAIVEITKQFSEYRMNLEEIDSSGRTPLMLAIQRNMKNLVELLLKKGACLDNNNVNHADNCGYSPLHIALPERLFSSNIINPEIIILLLLYGADPNKSYPYAKVMPLHVAIKHELTRIIKALLDHGAEKDRDIGYFKKCTAYDLAKKYSCSQTILDLLA